MTPLEFETAQAPKWSELEKLLTREEKQLDPERFLDLYRMCCEHLVLAHTPQVFRFDLLKRAFEAARADGFTGTDESSLVERLEEVDVADEPRSFTSKLVRL